MKQCVLCGEELHLDEYNICSLCDPNGNLNYRGVSNAGQSKSSIKKQKRDAKEKRNREVSNDY